MLWFDIISSATLVSWLLISENKTISYFENDFLSIIVTSTLMVLVIFTAHERHSLAVAYGFQILILMLCSISLDVSFIAISVLAFWTITYVNKFVLQLLSSSLILLVEVSSNIGIINSILFLLMTRSVKMCRSVLTTFETILLLVALQFMTKEIKIIESTSKPITLEITWHSLLFWSDDVSDGVLSNHENEKYFSVQKTLQFVYITVVSLFLIAYVSVSVHYYYLRYAEKTVLSMISTMKNGGKCDEKHTGLNDILSKLVINTAVLVSTLYLFTFPLLSRALHNTNPVLWLLTFIFRSPGRLVQYTCALWLVLITITVTTVNHVLNTNWKKTNIRKLFHLLVCLLFIPAVIVKPLRSFLCLALGLVLCLFMIFEYLRNYVLVADTVSHGDDNLTDTISEQKVGSSGGVSTNNNPNTVGGSSVKTVSAVQSVSSYLSHLVHNDEQVARKGFTLSHISLLLGVTIPVYMSVVLDISAAKSDIIKPRTNAQEIALLLLPHLGLITIGVGDSLASVFGSLYGKLKWSLLLKKLTFSGGKSNFENKKTVFGSVMAFLGMVVVSIAILLVEIWVNVDLSESQRNVISGRGGGILFSLHEWYSMIAIVTVTMLLTALTEAFTVENDNIVLPLYACIVYMSLILTWL